MNTKQKATIHRTIAIMFGIGVMLLFYFDDNMNQALLSGLSRDNTIYYKIFASIVTGILTGIASFYYPSILCCTALLILIILNSIWIGIEFISISIFQKLQIKQG